MVQSLTSDKKPVFYIGMFTASVLASAFAFPAWAGRPLATEDAGVSGLGECEIESYVGNVRDSSSGITTRWAQLGCGLGHDTQLAFGAGSERSDGEKKRPVALMGKTFVRELTAERTGYTLAYTLFGAMEPGNSFKHEATELKAVVSAPRGAWLFHANLGLQYWRTNSDYITIWGMAAERPGAIGPVDLMAEIIGDDGSAPWVQAAVRWAVIHERFYLDTSWGIQTDSDSSKQITVGLTLAL